MNTKQPIVRPGQKKGYTKATRQQIEHRVESAALLRFCGFEKSEIHRVFRVFYGVEWRQCDRYMALARARDGLKRPTFPLGQRISLLMYRLKYKDLQFMRGL
jgi:methylphosphotriester-DNA--protein-cysteine methyltransferase